MVESGVSLNGIIYNNSREEEQQEDHCVGLLYLTKRRLYYQSWQFVMSIPINEVLDVQLLLCNTSHSPGGNIRRSSGSGSILTIRLEKSERYGGVQAAPRWKTKQNEEWRRQILTLQCCTGLSSVLPTSSSGVDENENVCDIGMQPMVQRLKAKPPRPGARKIHPTHESPESKKNTDSTNNPQLVPTLQELKMSMSDNEHKALRKISIGDS